MNEKTGKLESVNGGGHYKCVDCGTIYIGEMWAFTYTNMGNALCNGRRITLCPWCRPDTHPWRNGRGE